MKKLGISFFFVALASTGSVCAADMPARAPVAPPASSVPASAFFVGLGGSFSSANFGTQDVYAVGTSSVFQNGALTSTGSAAGPGSVDMTSELVLSPSVQAGYFQKFSGSNWLWGAKFSYIHLGATSTVNNVLIPQAGSNTPVGGNPVSFTGTAVARTYQTSIEHQMALTPFIGHSFEKSFVYLGAGPTSSRVRTNVNGLVGFANVTGHPTDVSGAPTDFSGSGWVYGASATVGATYFFNSSWFADFSYTYAVTANKTFDYASPFYNPNGAQGSTINGTLVGSSSGKVITQAVAVTINMAF
jgi:hypothetical protein